jgi:hypothetical protein
VCGHGITGIVWQSLFVVHACSGSFSADAESLSQDDNNMMREPGCFADENDQSQLNGRLAPP